MKNMIVAGLQLGQEALSFARLEAYVQAQIENSLEVGWDAKDILFLTNFDYEFMGVKAQQTPWDDLRLRSLKLFAVHAFFRRGSVDDVLWVHDLDAWQNSWFDCPSFKDIGICEYREYSRPSFAGGSVFYRPTAKDLVMATHSLMRDREAVDEEAAFNQVLSEPTHRHRVTVLNSTYNMGYMNFAERYVRGHKPIRVCHFHPECPKSVAVHMWGRNFLRARTVNARLERLIRRYFDVPSEGGDESRGKTSTGAAPT
jgi:hypothetical protein